MSNLIYQDISKEEIKILEKLRFSHAYTRKNKMAEIEYYQANFERLFNSQKRATAKNKRGADHS